MNNGSRIGSVEVVVNVPPGYDINDRPPDEGIVVRCVIDEPDHADGSMLKRGAYEALLLEVDREGDVSLQSFRALHRNVSSFPWHLVFREGMPVCGRNEELRGVVMRVMNYSGDEVPPYELLVDGEGEDMDGVGLLDPWTVVPDDAPDSVPDDPRT